jgi:hypothetical protein
MTSFTNWLRFEPRPRTASLEESFEARVHDPLWLLGRQWQLGEYQGEDVGTPVHVQLSVADAQLDAVGIGSVVRSYDPGIQPLEMIVEQEALPGTAAEAWRRGALHGLQFLRMLDAALGARYRADITRIYELRMTPPGPNAAHPLDNAFMAVTAGRVPNGFAMAAEWEPWVRGQAPAPAFIDTAHVDPFRKVAERWLAWRHSVLAEPDDAASGWSPSRLSYAVTVSGTNPDTAATTQRIVLEAADYRGGRLDWYSFDAGNPAPFSRQPPGSVHAETKLLLPTALAFRGMPSPRWWEFEDGTVALGNTDVAPEDLARLLLLEFAFCYANDYFVVPVQLTPGSLCHINDLVVTNTFGDVIRVAPVRPKTSVEKPWRMFMLNEGDTSQIASFFLPPALAPTLDGAIMEEVFLARDEMANTVWAFERTVESPAGYAVHLQERAASLAEPDAATQPALDRWTYTLASPVPTGWFPYAPVQMPRVNGVRPRAVQLQRVSARAPSSVLLRAAGADVVNEEEVPRRGVRVTRSYQLARWINGETYVWSTRAVAAGRGETASGLRFDATSAAHATE